MFTGVITITAKIISINAIKDNYSVILEYFESKKMLKGESIAIDGICMSVTSHNKQQISFSLAKDIFEASNFTLNKIVNIERAMRTNNEKRGHFITGKIDQLGTIKYSKIVNNTALLTIGNINENQLQYLFPKCVIAINGVSLAIQSINGNTLSIKISSHIIANTNLRLLRPRDSVHIEYCIVAKSINKKIIYHLQHIDSIN
jgi:riboflavin synthase